MKINFTRLALAMALCASMALSVDTVFAKPPDWAPAHGYRAKQKYRYYPNQQVYYSGEQKKYFWLSGGQWQIGVKLPDGIKLGSSGVTVELDTDKPFEKHSEVRKKYAGKK